MNPLQQIGRQRQRNLRIAAAIASGLAGDHLEVARKRKKRLPTFIIIGAAKSATTTLAACLNSHPEIFISRPKEPKFFGINYPRGWSWYRSKFRKGRKCAHRGEASTMYTSALPEYRQTPRLMALHLPDLKLIYLVRHPLERLVSQWRHLRGRDPRIPGLERALRHPRIAAKLVGGSLYHQRLQSYRNHFADEQILCLTFEDLVLAPEQTLGRVLAFLGTDQPSPASLLVDGCLPLHNPAGDKGRIYVEAPDLSPRLRRSLIHQLRPDAEAFLAQLGKPSDYWRW